MMRQQRSVLALVGAVGVSLLLSAGVQAGDRYSHSQNGYQNGYQSGRQDGYSGATRHKESGELSPETHRALRSFERQKGRDYRRLGQQRFSSHQARERAYRELRLQHQDRLHNILGDSRFNDDRYRHYRDGSN